MPPAVPIRIAIPFIAILLPGLLAAQDAKSLLRDVSKAMGAENVLSVEYSGSGFFYWFGQAANPDTPWPKFNAKQYRRVINFESGRSLQTVVRTQYENPPHGGGNQPLIGEETLTQTVSTADPWGRDSGVGFSTGQQLEFWITPFGFLKGAMENQASLSVKTLAGYRVISYKVHGQYLVNGYINRRNLVEKVETWTDNALLGDLRIEATYTDYRNFGSLKFPAGIVETQGGHPVLELTISKAVKNAAADIPLPAAQAGDPNKVTVEQPAPGVFFLRGTHNSVAISSGDYVVVIEAPLNEARSIAVIAEVNRLFPGLPIRYVINSHQHLDHSGGLRTYVARSASVITDKINQAYYENALKLPHTLHPDELSLAPRPAVIEAVADKRVLTVGEHVIELYHLENAGHADGMLIVYLPAEKIVIEADEFTAGPPNATASPVANPYAAAVVDFLDARDLKYQIVLGLHGRAATGEELRKAAGKPN